MKLLISLLAVTLSYCHLCSQNLVSNPGFESYTSLPNAYGQIALATGWTAAGSGIGDYYHTSGSAPTGFGPIAPHGGGGQMGFLTRHSTAGVSMEYLRCNLTGPMTIGTMYEVSFYVTRGTGGGLYPSATGNLGVYFSTTLPTQAGTAHINVVPQVEQTTIIDPVNTWMHLTFYYTATAAFTGMTIGNFHSFASTPYSGGDGRAYYFVDDIVVMPGIPLGPDEFRFEAVKQSDKVALLSWDESDESVISIDVQRSTDGMAYEKLATLGPETSSWYDEAPFPGKNHYRIRLTKASGTIQLSEEKAVVFQDELELAAGNPYPNPFLDWFTIPVLNTGSEKSMEFEVIDLLGNVVYSSEREVANGLNAVTLDLTETSLVKGTYLVVITSESGEKQQIKVSKE
ncbi:MAG TPA: T9SS type A sorting domain-containing protein [Fluviicola sp.]|nr:T9SS type A sorting domain-containing protein [Fluviicola sp.]